MNSLKILVHWLTQHPFAASAFCFGGAIVAMTLYTYVVDHETLAKRD